LLEAAAMNHRASAALVLVAAMVLARPASADDAADAQVLAISRKHCVPCHARDPAHPAFAKPPREIALETIGELQRHAAGVLEQVVETRAMPLGNETGMTEAERDALARWIAALR
jgi:uncharacterized membrane protein